MDAITSIEGERYLAFLGTLPHFQYQGADSKCTNILNGCVVSIPNNRTSHKLCLRWPGQLEPACFIDAGKFVMLQIEVAKVLGSPPVDVHCRELLVMLGVTPS